MLFTTRDSTATGWVAIYQMKFSNLYPRQTRNIKPVYSYGVTYFLSRARSRAACQLCLYHLRHWNCWQRHAGAQALLFPERICHKL